MLGWVKLASGVIKLISAFMNYLHRQEIKQGAYNEVSKQNLERRLGEINKVNESLDRLRSDPEFLLDLRKRANRHHES